MNETGEIVVSIFVEWMDCGYNLASPKNGCAPFRSGMSQIWMMSPDWDVPPRRSNFLSGSLIQIGRGIFFIRPAESRS